jgi:preprotein translocase subunit SecG
MRWILYMIILIVSVVLVVLMLPDDDGGAGPGEEDAELSRQLAWALGQCRK